MRDCTEWSRPTLAARDALTYSSSLISKSVADLKASYEIFEGSAIELLVVLKDRWLAHPG
jgi:hypothetical protein